jgi:hypothetical protein
MLLPSLVILSAAKGLTPCAQRCSAALNMTALSFPATLRYSLMPGTADLSALVDFHTNPMNKPKSMGKIYLLNTLNAR